jgi:hypothetical protein
MLGKMEMALLWAEKELELDRVCVGDDHPHIQVERDAIEKLKEAIRDSRPVDVSVLNGSIQKCPHKIIVL